MQVGRHVGSQTRSGRRTPRGLQREVVRAAFSHAHIPEVEALWSQAVCGEQRLRGW